VALTNGASVEGCGGGFMANHLQNARELTTLTDSVAQGALRLP
jgi:hypothetical protein